VQGHAADGHAAGVADEVEQAPACGVGVPVEEVGDGPGGRRHEFAVGAPPQTVMGSRDYLLGGEALLGGGGGAAEAEQAGDRSHREAGRAVEEKVAEQADGVIVVAAALPEAKGGGEQGTLGSGQGGLGDGGAFQPTGKVRRSCGPGGPSAASGDGSTGWRRSGKFTH
jgi:hypothetical protein